MGERGGGEAYIWGEYIQGAYKQNDKMYQNGEI